MNVITVLSSAAILLASSSSLAHEFIAADNTPATQLCMAVASNHKLTLRKEVREHNISRPVLTNRLACNNMSIDTFATLYNLENSANFLNIDMTTSTHIRDLSASINNTQTTLVISGSK
ncbi:DUF3718 domain-containing protein [Pseudoalteromonas sp. MMG012]|uniref:DUF3718 domain-containing protein n=1 Tax=Pseudoalteromonas sp. MMG012 TaxID=2822686 RepID=UPI001B3A6AF9|nr:DUF3718 domain-containing protein [Pseudoalteromonas sp. MMG012]MBQ4852603.1 DUF3718 domain-containing protein [Pseudoalteromonas sp. MMG012]